jgi:predicted NUDIX family NTP pyrophosphohydrolase
MLRPVVSSFRRPGTIRRVTPSRWARPNSRGKLVHVWAIEGDWNPADLRSNTFDLEWPPRSRRLKTFPEIDRAASFDIAEAHIRRRAK